MFAFLTFIADLAPYLIAGAYFLGQFANFWNHASSIVASPKMLDVPDYPSYLRKYGPRLLVRFLWNTIIVIVVSLIPKLFFPNYSLDVHIANLSQGMAILFKCAVACAFGLLADVIIKKAQDVLKSKGVDVSEAIPDAPSGKTQVYEVPINDAGKDDPK